MAEGSDTRGGGSYSTIYADSRAWVKNGWVDYIMPQIYWNIGYEIADYTVSDRPEKYWKWQWTSKGKLPGISGNVDLSIFYN